MPRRYKKKRNTKTTKRRSRKSMISRLPIGGFPKSKLVRLRYVDECSIDPAAGSVARHAFSANGVYDPNITGTGHQPMNFDSWSTFYDHYTVLGSKCTASLVAAGSSAITPGYFGILLSDTGNRSSGMAPYQLLEERGFRHGKHIAGDPTTSTTGNSFPRAISTYSASKFFGVPKKAIAAMDKIQGTNSANPSDQAVYEVVVGAINANDPGIHTVLVQIDYLVLFSEPKPGVYS